MLPLYRADRTEPYGQDRPLAGGGELYELRRVQRLVHLREERLVVVGLGAGLPGTQVAQEPVEVTPTHGLLQGGEKLPRELVYVIAVEGAQERERRHRGPLCRGLLTMARPDRVELRDGIEDADEGPRERDLAPVGDGKAMAVAVDQRNRGLARAVEDGAVAALEIRAPERSAARGQHHLGGEGGRLGHRNSTRGSM
jgi:hypothetical protein